MRVAIQLARASVAIKNLTRFRIRHQNRVVSVLENASVPLFRFLPLALEALALRDVPGDHIEQAPPPKLDDRCPCIELEQRAVGKSHLGFNVRPPVALKGFAECLNLR